MSDIVPVARIFVGVKIYPDEYFDNHLKQIRKSLQEEDIRWVRNENMHITLRFIGECKEDGVAKIHEMLGKIASDTSAFQVEINGIGLFRSISYPKVLWAGVRESPDLKSLKMETDKMLNSVGFSFKSENFTPHLTLGRMRRINEKPRIEKLLNEYRGMELLIQPVESIVLFESVIKPGYTNYVSLSEHSFL